MNDPVLDTAISTSAATEPRHWLPVLLQRLRELLRPRSDGETLREAVEELIEEPSAASGVSPAERMLLANIITLRERRAGNCMVPRADIVAADAGTSLKELIDLMAASAHSRIPIHRGTLDEVIGMVHMKDIIPLIAHQQTRDVSELLRPVMFVAPSMPASRLLLQMRQTRQHMALVVDEFGGIDGLVTIEDLLEEVVGEIEDEHDAPADSGIITRADGTLLVDARLPIEEFEARTGMSLHSPEEEAFDTLGGYVANLAGRVPQIGESFRNETGASFEILETDQSRIKRLRVRAPRRDPVPEAKKAAG